MGNYYVNDEVRKMYGIPLSQLTPEQREILRKDGERRKKLVEERQKDFMQNNKRAFDDAEKMNKVLTAIYAQCQKEILADVAETVSKVKKAGGEWSYANQSALTRSRGLFEQINKELVKLGKAENTLFRKDLSNIYTDQFLRTVYTLGQTQNVSSNFNLLNPRLIQDTLDYPWSGAMFSDRLWLDKDRLGNNLRIGLTQSMILGEDMDKIADRIGANINTSRYNAMRIARTETKRVTYVSQVAAWKEQNIKEVRYMAANHADAQTCDLCRADNGKKFILGEEPTLPRHPNCRCWYVPITPDTFEDNELNELTGSVRGAENYEKWRQNEEAKIKAAQYPDTEKTPQELIREKVEEDMRRGREERHSITLQIDALEDEREKIHVQYSKKLEEIEVEKGSCRDIMRVRADELDDLNLEIQKLQDKRTKTLELLDAEKITEDEYYSITDEIRAERRRIRGIFSEKEDELYQADNKLQDLEREVTRIKKEIRDKQNEVTEKIKGLNEEIKKSLNKELDLSLDIDYVGDSMERYQNIDLFRSLREAHRACPTFDMDNYKDELVRMAQRMDKEALVIQEKMTKYVEKNSYNLPNTGWYNWHVVEMDMSDNSHEKALKNGLKGSWQTKFHEEGHQIDHILGEISEFCDNQAQGVYSCMTNKECSIGKEMGEALEKDILNFINLAVSHCNSNGSNYNPLKSLDRISGDAKTATIEFLNDLTSDRFDSVKKCQIGILTDAIGCYTKGNLHPYNYGYWGHRASYCKAVGKNGAISETWATFCALRVCGSKEEINEVKKIMPETWKKMSEVYSKIAKYLLTNNI